MSVLLSLSIFYRKMSSAKQEIDGLAKKENDYLTAISCLRTSLENMMKKAEEQASSAAELAAVNAQLREENKVTIKKHCSVTCTGCGRTD
jgi:chromosome segregation ATPase